jgi:hypothetical protein
MKIDVKFLSSNMKRKQRASGHIGRILRQIFRNYVHISCSKS